MMPVMDGYKVLQVVKTDPKLAKIPVLVFSAKGQPEEVEKALSLGAAGYVVKATTKPKEVIERIKSVLAKPVSQEEQEVPHYSLEIVEGVRDVAKLADDFKLNKLRCPTCMTKMLLELVPDFSQDTPWFSGKFYCPRCSK
jgi:CheY-like chemotaxis protein